MRFSRLEDLILGIQPFGRKGTLEDLRTSTPGLKTLRLGMSDVTLKETVYHMERTWPKSVRHLEVAVWDTSEIISIDDPLILNLATVAEENKVEFFKVNLRRGMVLRVVKARANDEYDDTLNAHETHRQMITKSKGLAFADQRAGAPGLPCYIERLPPELLEQILSTLIGLGDNDYLPSRAAVKSWALVSHRWTVVASRLALVNIQISTPLLTDQVIEHAHRILKEQGGWAPTRVLRVRHGGKGDIDRLSELIELLPPSKQMGIN
ncbi:hypothetical protein FRB90_000791 [Tulasnella sp. 427]|nr:hypothetical protein FRB90_000791 [Tulasnella sp. 427]